MNSNKEKNCQIKILISRARMRINQYTKTNNICLFWYKL